MGVPLLVSAALLAMMPATTNYRLNSYGFGSGGTSNSQTSTYSLEGTSGELSGQTASTPTASTKPGFTETQQANVPKIAAVSNNGGLFYNKLRFVIDPQGNPSDAKYLVSVSTDNFVNDIKYLQPDGTLSSGLALSQYQTYSAFGGNAGSLIVGLNPATTYSIRAKVTQGKFTESAFGPVVSQATAAQTLSFTLTTSNQSSPPYSVGFGTLTAGTITDSAQTINNALTTNGATGANVYVRSQNEGLLSGSTGFKINALSTDLASVQSGFGAQSLSNSQASGGPFIPVAPYNGTENTVGVLGNITRSLYTSAGPVSNATGTVRLKAKASLNDVAASDYQEVITFTAAGNF